MDELQVVLASASPRRLALLRRLGLEPKVIPADVDEVWRVGESAQALVGRRALSHAQAGAVAASALVLGA
ncbi:MAG: septum formation protein, partial [Glaciecola sp.]